MLSKITAPEKAVVTPEQVLEIAQNEKLELLVTVGAGDIDKLVKPLKEILVNA
ncbi:hypothetical protein D3C85_1770160 [compost metagenome]